MKDGLLKKTGFSLLEIVLAVAIFSAGSISVGYLIIDSLTATDINNKKITATFLAREGIAAIRSIRDDDGFSALINGTYGLSFDEDTEIWETSGSEDVSDDGQYTRVITIGNGIDSHTKEIVSSVTVPTLAREITVSFTTFLTDWR